MGVSRILCHLPQVFAVTFSDNEVKVSYEDEPLNILIAGHKSVEKSQAAALEKMYLEPV